MAHHVAIFLVPKRDPFKFELMILAGPPDKHVGPRRLHHLHAIHPVHVSLQCLPSVRENVLALGTEVWLLGVLVVPLRAVEGVQALYTAGWYLLSA